MGHHQHYCNESRALCRGINVGENHNHPDNVAPSYKNLLKVLDSIIDSEFTVKNTITIEGKDYTISFQESQIDNGYHYLLGVQLKIKR